MPKPKPEPRRQRDAFGEYEEIKVGGEWKVNKRFFKQDGKDVVVQVRRAKSNDLITAIQITMEGTLKMNEMSDRIETIKGPITDPQLAILRDWLRDVGFVGEKKMEDALLHAAYINRYHPIRDYLEGLEPWDNEDRFSQLMNCLKMNSPGAVVFWRKFLLGMIAKAIDAQQNYMLVLMGAQGKGKSRLARWLCPLQDYFAEGPIRTDDKDSYIRLINNWLWEVAELDATTKRADRSALKGFITTKFVKVRVPFGRYDINKPAASSLIGTINEDGTGFLNDPTGNRRFAIVKLEDINWEYEQINIHQLWAQMYEAYLDGETWELTPEEGRTQNDINEEYTTISTVESLLHKFYEIKPNQPKDQGTWIRSTDILAYLEDNGLKGNQRANLMELSSVLKKGNVTRWRHKNVWGWCGVTKRIGSVAEINL